MEHGLTAGTELCVHKPGAVLKLGTLLPRPAGVRLYFCIMWTPMCASCRLNLCLHAIAGDTESSDTYQAIRVQTAIQYFVDRSCTVQTSQATFIVWGRWKCLHNCNTSPAFRPISETFILVSYCLRLFEKQFWKGAVLPRDQPCIHFPCMSSFCTAFFSTSQAGKPHCTFWE